MPEILSGLSTFLLRYDICQKLFGAQQLYLYVIEGFPQLVGNFLVAELLEIAQLYHFLVLGFQLFDAVEQAGEVLLGDEAVFHRWGSVGHTEGLSVLLIGYLDGMCRFLFAQQVDMHIFGNRYQPGIKSILGIISRNAVEGLNKGFDGNILGIGFVLGAFEHEAVDLVPIAV